MWKRVYDTECELDCVCERVRVFVYTHLYVCVCARVRVCVCEREKLCVWHVGSLPLSAGVVNLLYCGAAVPWCFGAVSELRPSISACPLLQPCLPAQNSMAVVCVSVCHCWRGRGGGWGVCLSRLHRVQAIADVGTTDVVDTRIRLYKTYNWTCEPVYFKSLTWQVS